MSRVLSNRELETIQRIQDRENRVVAIPRSNIPKTPQYYEEMRAKALEQNEPYIASVYKRCAKLAREGGKQREITRLLFIANETIKRKRGEQNPQPEIQERHPRNKRNTRSKGPAKNKILDKKPTLNNFVNDYVSSIKHKKELLLTFLLKMYRLGYRYNDNTKKWFLP